MTTQEQFAELNLELIGALQRLLWAHSDQVQASKDNAERVLEMARRIKALEAKAKPQGVGLMEELPDAPTPEAKALADIEKFVATASPQLKPDDPE